MAGKAKPPARTGDDAGPLHDLQHEMNRLFDDLMLGFDLRCAPAFAGWGAAPPALAAAPFEVVETAAEICITAELPGLDAGDIEVSLDDNVITVKGGKKAGRMVDDGRRYVVEQSSGAFERSFTLPPDADLEKIEASFEKGVLTLRIARSRTPIERARKIPLG